MLCLYFYKRRRIYPGKQTLLESFVE